MENTSVNINTGHNYKRKIPVLTGRTKFCSHTLLKSRQPNNKSFIEELAAWLTAAAHHSPDAHIYNGPSSPG